jgi:hypothetical protein
MWDLYYHGVKLNREPLTLDEANNQIGLIIINYGYRPEKKTN